MRMCDDFSYFAMNLLIYVYIGFGVCLFQLCTFKAVHISYLLRCLVFVFSLSSFPRSLSFVHHVSSTR